MEKYRKLIAETQKKHNKIYLDTTLNEEEKIEKFEELLTSTYPKKETEEYESVVKDLFRGSVFYDKKSDTLERADKKYRLHYLLGNIAHLIQERLTIEECFFANRHLCGSSREYQDKTPNKHIIWDFTYDIAHCLELSQNETCMLYGAFANAVEVILGDEYLLPRTLGKTKKTNRVIYDIFTNILQYAQGINVCEHKNIGDFLKKQ